MIRERSYRNPTTTMANPPAATVRAEQPTAETPVEMKSEPKMPVAVLSPEAANRTAALRDASEPSPPPPPKQWREGWLITTDGRTASISPEANRPPDAEDVHGEGTTLQLISSKGGRLNVTVYGFSPPESKEELSSTAEASEAAAAEAESEEPTAASEVAGES